MKCCNGMASAAGLDRIDCHRMLRGYRTACCMSVTQHTAWVSHRILRKKRSVTPFGKGSLFLGKQLFELCRVGRFKTHDFSRYGVIKAEFERMKGQTPNGIYFFQAVTPVSNDGMS